MQTALKMDKKYIHITQSKINQLLLDSFLRKTPYDRTDAGTANFISTQGTTRERV